VLITAAALAANALASTAASAGPVPFPNNGTNYKPIDPPKPIGPISNYKPVQPLKAIGGGPIFKPVDPPQPIGPISNYKPVDPLKPIGAPIYKPVDPPQPIGPISIYKPVDPLKPISGGPIYKPVDPLKPISGGPIYKPVDPQLLPIGKPPIPPGCTGPIGCNPNTWTPPKQPPIEITVIENDVYAPGDPGVTYVAPAGRGGVTYVAPAGMGAPAGRSHVVTSTPRPSAQGFVSQPAVSPMTAAPTTCLTKQYQSDGSALFQDTCTHEFAVATLEQRRVQAAAATTPAVPAGQSCLTKQYLQDSSVLFQDVCTKEYAVAAPAQRNNVVGSVDAGRPAN
jgi:hypothetical protein